MATAENITLTCDAIASGNKGVGRLTNVNKRPVAEVWLRRLLKYCFAGLLLMACAAISLTGFRQQQAFADFDAKLAEARTQVTAIQRQIRSADTAFKTAQGPRIRKATTKSITGRARV